MLRSRHPKAMPLKLSCKTLGSKSRRPRAWHTLALDALRDGKLVAPFEHRVDTGAAYWLVTSARIPPSPDVRAFGAWVEREFAAAH